MLKQKGLDVTLLSTDSTTAAEFEKNGIPVVDPVVILRDVRLPSDVKALLQLTCFLSKNRFDIVHTHTSKPGFIGRLAARLSGVPLVFHTSHRFAFDIYTSKLKSRFFARLERLAGEWTDQLFVVSQQNLRLALNHKIIPKSKISYIPNSIEWKRFAISEKVKLAKKTELGLAPESLVIGMVGRLSLPKLPGDFVQACALISERWPQARFLIIGDGPERSNIEFLIERCGLKGKLLMTGFRQDIPELLSILDVFVLPTRWEGMSISLLEAMAAGKPIVTTDIECNREVVKDGQTAVLVPPGKPTLLASAVERLLADREFATVIGARARQTVIERFSHEQMLEQIWHIYELQIQQRLFGLNRYPERSRKRFPV
jgi:glycosyltransferase involved in cell wall biosynthesis